MSDERRAISVPQQRRDGSPSSSPLSSSVFLVLREEEPRAGGDDGRNKIERLWRRTTRVGVYAWATKTVRQRAPTVRTEANGTKESELTKCEGGGKCWQKGWDIFFQAHFVFMVSLVEPMLGVDGSDY
ncbi:hypothetical protein Dimus_007854 [Dionaea muscipula]